MPYSIERFGALVGASPRLQQVFELIRKAAKVDIPVLVIGETGTGKDVIAREIHSRSSRAAKPYVAVNMGMLTQELVSSELFGHVKGAFTGATENKAGRFAEANGGTLFLDEIGTMEEHTQIALLRVLESHDYRPLGAKEDKKTDVRLIAATNEPLDEAVDRGQFREDLLHRLQVLTIDAPPLRDIVDDIPMLATHFCRVVAEDFHAEIPKLSDSAMACLREYDWPGNMRELKNVIAQSAVLSEGAPIDVDHLPARVRSSKYQPAPHAEEPGQFVEAIAETRTPAQSQSELNGKDGIFIPLGASLDEVQKTYVVKILSHCGNNKTQAAKILGMSRKTLYDRLSRWGLRD